MDWSAFFTKILTKQLEELIAFNKIQGRQTLFQCLSGGPIHHRLMVTRFKRDLRQSGLRAIRLYDLRHTAATLMLLNGVDVKSLQNILGHSEIEMTMAYTHLLGTRIKQVAKMHSISPSKKASLKVVS